MRGHERFQGGHGPFDWVDSQSPPQHRVGAERAVLAAAARELDGKDREVAVFRPDRVVGRQGVHASLTRSDSDDPHRRRGAAAGDVGHDRHCLGQAVSGADQVEGIGRGEHFIAQQRRVWPAHYGDQPGALGEHGQFGPAGEVVDVETERSYLRPAAQGGGEVIEGQVHKLGVQPTGPCVRRQHRQAQIPVEGSKPA
jgi:hypothetical protein